MSTISDLSSFEGLLQAIKERIETDGEEAIIEEFEIEIPPLRARLGTVPKKLSGENRTKKTNGALQAIKHLIERSRLLQPHIKRWVAEEKAEQKIIDYPGWLLAVLSLMDPATFDSMLRGNHITFHMVESVLRDDSVALQTVEQLMDAAWQQRRDGTLSLEALEQDFCEPYVGSGSLELHQELGRNFRRDDQAYASVIPILQSSGVGKTRTVTELSAHAPGIMLCLRRFPTIDSRNDQSPIQVTTSLPKRDAGVCEFLLGEGLDVAPEDNVKLPSPVYKEEWFSHCRVAALLSATLGVIAEEMEIEKQAVEKHLGKQLGREEAWPLIVERISHKFFDGIVTGYVVRSTSPRVSPEKQQLSPKTSKRKTLIEDIVSRATVEFREYQEHKPEPDGDLIVYRSKVAETLADYLEPRLTEIDKYRADDHQYVFIALDEFDPFGHLLPAIRRLMSILSSKMLSRDSLRVLLLDTNNKLALVTGPEAHQASLRTTDGSKRLREPYLVISPDIRLLDGNQRVPFDDFLENNLTRTHGEILKFLRYMGRPLWGDRLYETQSDQHGYAGFSLDRVLRKMGCEARQDEQYIALAASRLPLTIVGLQGTADSASFLQSQIANHLRSIIGFANHGDRVDTASHSEPVMSLAAASMHRQSDLRACKKYWAETVEAIRRKQNSACLTIGENGEEFTRLLLTMAMDFQAQHSLEDDSSIRIPKNLAMINLRKLLESILGPLQLRQYVEHDTMVEHSWVNFTHFLRLGKQFNETNPCTTQDLVYFWTRQVAVIGVINQEAWDILIPIYHSDAKGRPSLDDNFEHRNMRFLMVQVKVDANETAGQAGKVNYKRAMRNDRAPKKAASLCLFVNLARDFETTIVKDEEMLLIYASGWDEQRFPLLKQFEARHTCDIILGLVGRPAAVRRAAKNPTPGSREEWKLRYQTGSAALWTTRNALTLNHEPKMASSSAVISKSATLGDDTQMRETQEITGSSDGQSDLDME